MVSKYKSLLFFVAATMISDGMLTIVLLWSILKSGGSIIDFGTVAFFMNVIPLIIQKYVPSIKKFIKENPLKMLSITRLIGVVMAIILYFSDVDLPSLYIAAGVFSIISFLSMQSLEVSMSLLVLGKKITSDVSSRMLQTGIQLGIFSGNALGGYILSWKGLNVVFLFVAFFLMIGGLFPVVLKHIASEIKDIVQEENKDEKNEVEPKKDVIQKDYRYIFLWMSTIIITLLSIQIPSYNFFIPVIFEQVKNWSSSTYGTISALAGVGAFLSSIVIIPKRPKLILMFFFILFIGICDGVLAYSYWKYLAMLFSFILGYSMNSIRIFERSKIYENIKDSDESLVWSSRITFLSNIPKALVPILFSIVLHYSQRNSYPLYFMTEGVIISILILMIYSYRIILQKREA